MNANKARRKAIKEDVSQRNLEALPKSVKKFGKQLRDAQLGN
jgi:hypothetical protein